MSVLLKLQRYLGAFLIVLLALPAYAMTSEQKKEFDRIANLKMSELTEEAIKAFEKKYPNEDWSRYNFPQFVFTNDATETAYKIAVKEPGLLSKITCYCFCDRMGHQSLLYCFVQDGKPGGEFDRHGST